VLNFENPGCGIDCAGILDQVVADERYILDHRP
jgi:hypothetical protein